MQVDGNWARSSLVAGAVNGVSGNAFFGDDNDAYVAQSPGFSSITSVTIEGAISGSPIVGTDHFGFVAGKIGAFRAGASKVLLQTNEGNDRINLTPDDDVTIHEIGTAAAGTVPTAPAPPRAVASHTYTDLDGDTVRITSTKGTEADLISAATITMQGQLQKLDLNAAKFGTKFNGAAISISVSARGLAGNGLADVGEIDATGIALGAVTVKGDLGRIAAGTSATKPAIGSLTLNSLGGRLTSTGAPDLHSVITGNLGPVKILGDVQHAYLDVAGTLGATTIGGDLIGGDDEFEGYIKAAGNVGAFKIGGSVFGGSANLTGALSLADDKKIVSLFIGGDLSGNTGTRGASIVAGSAGDIFIGGNIGGGDALLAGSVNLDAATSFTLGGDLSAGNAALTGGVTLNKKSGAISIGGNISGRTATDGFFTALAPVTTFTVNGSIRNGSVSGSGAVSLSDATSIFVGGTIFGSGAANASVDVGGLIAGKVGTVTINGALVGGGGGTSGTLTLASATTVKILGEVGGNTPLSAGNIHIKQSVGTLDFGSRVVGATILIGGADSKPNSVVANKVHVGGAVSASNFFFGSLERADVKVGTATFDGNWGQSNLVVGAVNLGTDDAVSPPDNKNFGDGHDHRAATGTAALSSIASIIVEGRIVGSGTNGEHFGFVAGKITAFRAGSFALPLHATGAPDVVTFTITGNVTVTEDVKP